MAVAGSEGAAIHPAAAAREGEPIVVKHRVSPFVGTDREMLHRRASCSLCLGNAFKVMLEHASWVGASELIVTAS
jgi:nicotinamidase-related amidase